MPITNKELIFANHAYYYQIAKVYQLRAETYDEQLLKAIESKPTEAIAITIALAFPIFEHNVISLVFSVMTAEAFINDYAINQLLASKRKGLINNSDVVAKYKEFPYFRTGKYLPKELLNKLRKSYKLRTIGSAYATP